MLVDRRDETKSFPGHRYRASLCGSIALGWLLGLELRGLDIARVLSDWGVSMSMLRTANLRLPLFLARRFWEVAVRQSGDEGIGLELARMDDPVQLQGLGYLMQLMPTRLAALEQMQRYWPLLAGHAPQEVVHSGNEVRLRLQPYEDYYPAHAEVDFWVMRQLSHLRSLPGAASAARELHLRRPEPADPQPWLRQTRVPIVFGAAQDQLILDLEALQVPRNAGSEAIREALTTSLDEYAEQTGDASEMERVCAEVLHCLADNPGMEQVAERLHMTPRTLHRALQREGWSFTALVDEHRRLLAADLLDASDASIGQISDRLGFDEQSSFIRAFRRWYEMTPGGYRSRRG